MYDWKMDCEHGISYLPLSHVAAQIIDIYLSAYGGATISFADKEALQGSLINTLKEVNPTKFLGNNIFSSLLLEAHYSLIKNLKSKNMLIYNILNFWFWLLFCKNYLTFI